MPDTQRTADSHYVPPAKLAALVREYRRTGSVSNELALVLVQIAAGVWDKFRYTDSREDFVQECFLHLVGKPLAGCDPHKNAFSYLTQAVRWFGQKQRDRAAAERRRFLTYAQDLEDSGAPIPGGDSHRKTAYCQEQFDEYGPPRKDHRRASSRSTA